MLHMYCNLIDQDLQYAKHPITGPVGQVPYTKLKMYDLVWRLAYNFFNTALSMDVESPGPELSFNRARDSELLKPVP